MKKILFLLLIPFFAHSQFTISIDSVNEKQIHYFYNAVEINRESFTATHPLWGIDTGNIDQIDQLAIQNLSGYKIAITDTLGTFKKVKTLINKAQTALVNKEPLMKVSDCGTVTQLVSKVTPVIINTTCGKITMAANALAAAGEVVFTVTNSQIATTDVPYVYHASGGTFGAYIPKAGNVQNGSFQIMVSNCSAGSLSQAIVIGFTIKQIG